MIINDWSTVGDERIAVVTGAGRGIGRAYAGTPYAAYKVTLTGHSLGGSLASYAGHYVTKADVYTFDPARNVLAGSGANPKQINIIT